MGNSTVVDDGVPSSSAFEVLPYLSHAFLAKTLGN